MTPDVFGIVGTTQVGTFRVEKAVAEGGFAVVYRAFHTAFRAPVALKCLKVPEGMTAAQKASFLEKFREEAELLFQLSSAIPEVVRPLQVDALEVEDGRFVPFLALEWLEGDPLDKVIDARAAKGEPPLGLHELVPMLAPIAKALARAHRFPDPSGTIAVIHRDLKPENLFIATSGGVRRPKILDFGIATVKSAAAQAAGKADESDAAAAFSAGYAAPEQWAPRRFGQAGPWTDVWGMAVTLVEALAGRPITPADDQRKLRAVALDEKQRPTPRSVGVNIGPKIDRVFERALAVDPRARTQDMVTFWTDLEVALGMEPSIHAEDIAPGAIKRTSKRLSAELLFTEPVERLDFELAEVAPGSRATGGPGVHHPGDTELRLDAGAPAALDADLAFNPHEVAAPTSSQRAPPRDLRPAPPEAGPAPSTLRKQIEQMPPLLLIGLGVLGLTSVGLLLTGTLWCVAPLLLAGGAYAAFRFKR
jgi:eukaryotic-like serine/threonine-protein kinase